MIAFLDNSMKLLMNKLVIHYSQILLPQTVM